MCRAGSHRWRRRGGCPGHAMGDPRDLGCGNRERVSHPCYPQTMRPPSSATRFLPSRDVFLVASLCLRLPPLPTASAFGRRRRRPKGIPRLVCWPRGYRHCAHRVRALLGGEISIPLPARSSSLQMLPPTLELKLQLKP